MSIGDYMLDKITSMSLFHVDTTCPTPIIIWSSGAAEQLEAIALEAVKQAEPPHNPERKR